MKEKFDWGALQSFLAVVRAGRLTAAAQVLGVTHSTLSRRIAALERSLQAQLFHRSPAGYALTDRGRAVLEAAEAMESLAVSAQAEAGSARLRVAGTVRIGAPDGFGTRFLAPRLPNLTRRHPALLIQLVTMPRVFSLSKREADIAIGLTAPEQGRLHVRKLVDYQLGLYGAPTYLDTAGMPKTLEDLGRHRVIGYIDDLIYTPELDYLPLVAPGLRPSFASSNLLAQKEAIEAGHGLGVLPCFMADPGPSLCRVLPRVVALRRSFWLIVHADLISLARIRVTAEFIAREAQARREWFDPTL